MKNRSLLSVSGILLLAVIVIVLNGLSRLMLGSLTFDLTEDRLYSLSSGSKNILQTIQDPITLRYYFSADESSEIPALSLYGDRVENLLREYERAGNGAIRLEVIDPRPDTEAEEWAQRFGLTPLTSPTGTPLYFGLVAMNSLGEEQVIPFFDARRQEYMEYDITKLILTLTRTEQPTIGILSTLPMNAASQPELQQREPWVFLDMLRSTWKVEEIPITATTIDDSIDALLVVHPVNLSDETLFAIDQFVLKGGGLLVLADPYNQLYQDTRPSNAGNSTMNFFTPIVSSDLNKLTKKWGISVDEGKVIVDAKLAVPVSASPGAPPQPFGYWLGLTHDQVNSDDLAVGSLETLLLPWTGSLQVHDVDGVTTEVLLRSSDSSALRSASSELMGG
ncbi:MAG: GldG family protein, partial [Bdellovibrionales bacterium]|nr:GldG family protein [Bdellovibrionales bacterium]